MLNLPVPPHTLTTRQLECVSCKEIFTIAEGDGPTNGRAAQQWRLPSEQRLDTQLYYQPVRTLRSVTPESYSRPVNLPDQWNIWNHNQAISINCPRCGVDNRNWLRISTSNARWWKKFSLIVSFLIVSSLATVAYGYHMLNRDDTTLLVAFLLAAFVPVISIPNQWQRLRDYRNLHKFTRADSLNERLSPPLKSGLTYIALFVFVIPFLLYLLIPWTFELVAGSHSALVIKTEFLKTWFLSVGFSSLTAVITTLWVVEGFVSHLNKQLPRPIFYSVANMTRVVVWEAVKSLEIQGDINRIQWTYVKRDRQGGIILQGLQRGSTTPGTADDPARLVDAYRYTIHSDRWGRIETADITSVRVRQSLDEHRLTIGQDFFQRASIRPPSERISPS